MARAKRCDRCFSYYMEGTVKINNQKITQVRTVNDDGYYITEYDLCNDCMTSFIKFINGDNIPEIDRFRR